MKKLYLLLFLLIFAFSGCDSGSNSNSGGGGGGLNMNGNWGGQWTAEVKTGADTVQLQGGNLNGSLQLNGRQLTGTVNITGPLGSMMGNQPGHFSATISNPNGPGNIELGTIFNDSNSIAFHGSYSSNQIYGSFGSPSATDSVVKGNLTLTK